MLADRCLLHLQIFNKRNFNDFIDPLTNANIYDVYQTSYQKTQQYSFQPITAAAPSKAWVCGRSLRVMVGCPVEVSAPG